MWSLAYNFAISEKSTIIPRENCALPKCITSKKDKGSSLFKVPTPGKTNDESIQWTKDLIYYKRYYFEISCKRSISDKTYAVIYTLYLWRTFTLDQIYIYSTRKILKEGALLTLNFSRKSGSSTTKPRPANEMEESKE